jgi:hypothetical protein
MYAAMAELRQHRNFLFLGLGLLIASAAAGCGDDEAGDPTGSGGGGNGGSTSTGTGGSDWVEPSSDLFFDHRHTDLAQIPASCVDGLKSGSFVFHYAHRSHGSQIIHGAESIEGAMPAYGFASEYTDVPGETGVFKMWDGMTSTNLVEADQYWATEAGLDDLRSILTAHPEIRYSMWSWSYEISAQTEEQVQLYLETMDALEQEFPDVTFIYMTGTAEEELEGVNRMERNAQIRAFAEERAKVLYDFEDLDAWYNGEHHTQVVDGVEIPLEHPHYSLDTAGNVEYEYTHTTRESCENKARAFWWMMAKLEGCELP